MKKEMLINCLQSEEIRIAILEDGVLEELYVERASHESYVGNIYKGRIVNIEPSIQAAFVDFGVGRNGFLHVSDVEPAYYRDIEVQDHRRGGRGGDRGGRGGRGRGERGERGERGGRGRRQRDDREPRRDYAPPPIDENLPGDYAQPVNESSAPPPYEAPPPMHEGPDIIVEEIYDEPDEFYQQPGDPAAADPAPPIMQEEWPAAPDPNADTVHDEIQDETFDEVIESAESTDHVGVESAGVEVDEPESAAEEPDAVAEEKEEADEDKPKKRGSARGRGKAPRGRKPRKKTGEDPKPRPMDSSEHRTDENEPPLGPIEPKPGEIRDEDLSFSMSPPPAPPAAPIPPPPVHMPIDDEVIEDEEQVVVAESASLDEPEDLEELSGEPLEPAIAKLEPDESFEELVEEEKDLEAAGEVEAESEPVISEITDEAAPAFEQQEQEEFEDYMTRDHGGREPRGGRGERGERGRGGRGERGRGGRGERGPRGGRDAGRRPPGMGMRPKPHIEDIFKRGQEVLVQVIKEGIGTKGPTLSTYISIAGRYLVLMPGLNRIGVSRKIEDDDVRRRLREIMNELRPPRGLGFIIRTAGQDRNREELQSDLAYLSRLWQVVVGRIKRQKSPCEIYKESDMVTRTIRDIFSSDIDTIWVDERGAYEAAKEFMEAVMPRYADRIRFYEGAEPMFHRYGIEQEIARIQERKISLPQGGSIVIDQAEALVAIDVNSGNFRSNNQNAEETAYQMNLHAAKEIARQLRLRDLGGVIVNDFIDMREDRHRRGVEKALRDAVRRDRARTKILRISQFGLIEMTRQRIRPSLKRSAFQDCPHCHATGHVKTSESVSIEVMRMLQLAVNRPHIARIDVRVHDEVAQYLLNRKRREIVTLEEQANKPISVIPAGSAVSPEFLEFQCLDNNGNEVKFTLIEEPPPRPPQRRRH